MITNVLPRFFMNHSVLITSSWKWVCWPIYKISYPVPVVCMTLHNPQWTTKNGQMKQMSQDID